MVKTKEQLTSENKVLKNELGQIKDMLNKLMSQEQNKSIDIPQDEFIDIPLTKIIKVQNLTHGILNLIPDINSNRKFRFNRFGDIVPIPYQDLIQSISNQRKFYTNGYCRILDNEAIKANGFIEDYNKIPTASQIEKVLTFEDDEIKRIFTNAPKKVKETIVIQTLYKIANRENIDKNKVSIIEELYDLRDSENKVISLYTLANEISTEEG
jgi:hypothetical protein